VTASHVDGGDSTRRLLEKGMTAAQGVYVGIPSLIEPRHLHYAAPAEERTGRRRMDPENAQSNGIPLSTDGKTQKEVRLYQALLTTDTLTSRCTWPREFEMLS
jgi:hypothetical protein